MSFRSLNRRLRQLGDNFEENVDRFGRRAADRASITAIRGTPVDKGDARSNWQAGIGQRPSSVIPAYAPGSRRGIGERANLNGARAQNRGVIARWVPRRGKPLFLSNNVPYIRGLNEGTISQQGSRFVERAAESARTVIRNARWFRKARTPRT